MSLEKENNNILSDEDLENASGGRTKPNVEELLQNIKTCEDCGKPLPDNWTSTVCGDCQIKRWQAQGLPVR